MVDHIKANLDGDLYILKRILMGCTDDAAVRVLRNVRVEFPRPRE